MVLCGSYLLVGPYRQDQSTSRADRRCKREHRQSPTDRCLPPTLSLITAQTELQMAAVPLQWGRSWASVSRHTGPPPQWWVMCHGRRVFKVAGRRGRHAVFTLWSLKVRALSKSLSAVDVTRDGQHGPQPCSIIICVEDTCSSPHSCVTCTLRFL